MRDIQIRRIMTTNPATLGPNDPIAAAIKLLESDAIHHLPVVENDLLEGIVSSSDLLKFHLLDGDSALLSETPVRQIMEDHPVTLDSGASLLDAATRLTMGGYHALPVIEADRSLVGIVTSSDLIKYLMQHIPRGDGSIHVNVDSKPDSDAFAGDLSDRSRKGEQPVESGDDMKKLGQTLLDLRNQNRLLHNVWQAAEHYLRSGQAAREHTVLAKCLADIRNSSNEPNL